MVVLVAIEGLVIALLVVLVIGLLRSHGEVLRALRDLGIELGDDPPLPVPPNIPERTVEGTASADVVGVTPEGNERAIGVVGAPHSTLLAFLSSGCLTCADFWNGLSNNDGLEVPGDDTRLVVVTKGPEAESQASVARLAPRHIPTVMSSSAWDDYGIPVTPYFILVDGPSGRIAGEGAASSWGQLESLLSKAVADAGIITAGRQRRRSGTTRERRDTVDEVLANAGITPGHPSLHPDAKNSDDESDEDA